MVIDEFLIALGLRVDRSDIAAAENLGDAVENIGDSADNASRGLGRAYEATDGFVSGIEGALGILGFFTGVLGGVLASTHGVISELEELIEDEKLLTEVTKDQIRQAKAYNESVENLGKRFTSLRVEIAFSFLPALQRLVNNLDEFLKANQDLIVNGLQVLFNVISSISQLFTSFIRFIDLIIESTLGWEKTLYLLAAALAYVRRASILAFFTNPVTFIIAAIAGLLLLIDDFITYLDGGESEFGEFWGAMLDGIDAAIAGWNNFIDIVAGIFARIGDFFVGLYRSIVEALQPVVTFFTSIFGAIANIISGYVDIWSGIFGFITAAWRGDVEGARESLGKIFEGFKELFKGVADFFVTVFDAGVSIVVSLFTNLSALFQAYIDMWTNIFNGVIEFIPNAFKKATDISKTVVVGLFNFIINAARSFVTGIGNVFFVITELLKAPFKNAFDYVLNLFNRLPSLIGGIISRLPVVGAVSSIGSAITNGVNRVTNNIGGSTQATINITSPNPTSAANQTASALSNLQAQRNLGGQVIA